MPPVAVRRNVPNADAGVATRVPTARKLTIGMHLRTAAPANDREYHGFASLRPGTPVALRSSITTNDAGACDSPGDTCVTISHDVVERAARVVLETSACSKIVGAKQSNVTDGHSSELIGTLSLVGKLGGTLVVYCEWQQAVRLAAGMLARSTEPEADTVRDAMGEMVVQIGGTIKRYVGADGNEITLSPPVAAGHRLHRVFDQQPWPSTSISARAASAFVCGPHEDCTE
jgi:CheY-specific phosphatase CheX